MRRMAKVAAAAGAVVLAAGTYTALDIYDVVPGYLTLAAAPQPAVPAPGRASVGPRVEPPTAPPVPASPNTPAAPVPDVAAFSARIKAARAAAGLPGKVTMTFRDAATGATLYDDGARTAMTPASVTKLLATWAIARAMPLEGTFTTKVVSADKGSIVLVAGGDTCLNPKAGDPLAVCGRAGVGDLATQAAASLKKQGRNTVKLGYDATYAAGPATAPGWGADLLTAGFTTRIAMLGLSTQHAETGPAVPSPDASTTAALAKELRARGITVTTGGATPASAGSVVLASVQSAPLLDQLGFALKQSDNAMIESLARQAAYRSGVTATSEAAVTGWVRAQLSAAGYDLTGVKLADVSGLSDGTTLTAGLLGDLLTGATTGNDPLFADAITGLPVGGWSGTLAKRYIVPATSAAAGWVHAKTGSLPSVTSLAGTVQDKDGRLIVFSLIANGAQPRGPIGSRQAVDTVVTAVHNCGCS